MFFYPGIAEFMLWAYALCFAFINLIAYLISRFYRKKFGQPSPQAGFIAGMALPLVAIPMFAISAFAGGVLFIVPVLLIVGGVLCSAWAAVTLNLTMRKVRK